jgi:hypothetical protein
VARRAGDGALGLNRLRTASIAPTGSASVNFRPVRSDPRVLASLMQLTSLAGGELRVASSRIVEGGAFTAALRRTAKMRDSSAAPYSSRQQFIRERDQLINAMIIDLRFVEIGYELMVLSEYLKDLAAGLPGIVDTGKARVRDEYDDNPEEGDTTGAHLEYLLDCGVTTRFLTGSAVLATWAAYESGVKEVAEYLQKEAKLSRGLREFRGGFVKQARHYFDDIVMFPLHPSTTDWDRLNRLAELRNVLAHANGTLRDVSENRREHVKKVVASINGVSIVNDEYIVVSVAGAQDALAFVNELLDDLIGRVRSRY